MREPRRIWARCSGAIALVLGLLAMLTGPPGVAAQTGDSSIEVHNRICPTDYEGTDYFEDCHDTAPDAGYDFTFTNEDTGQTYEGTTNADGDIGFANLAAGTYTIVGGQPGDFTERYVYCAVGTEANSNREQIPVEYVSGGIQFSLPADTNVICDWYTIPIGQGPADPTPTDSPAADGSIEVHHRVCPADYAGNDWFADCHANVAEPGLPFTFADGVTREGTTNENGNVGFGNLPPGTYAITGGAPGEFTDMVVYCSAESTNEQVPVEYVTGGVQLELAAGTNVVCDWYAIPQSQDGQTPTPTEPVAGDSSIEVHNRICPEGYDGNDWFQDCHGNAPDPGLPFTFADGVTREGTTNENGNVGFANLPSGTYTITGGAPGEFTDDVVYCSTEGTNEQVPVEYVTGGIQLDLAANINVVCDWYTIPQGQSGQTPTVAPESFDLPIFALLCNSAPGDGAASDFVMTGTVPAGCDPFAGAAVTISAQGGSTYGSCTTSGNDPCYVTVDVGATVLATIDPATLPDGYAPSGPETQEIEIPPASEAWVLFVATPVSTPTTTPTETATTTPTPVVTETPVAEGRALELVTGTCEPDGLIQTVVQLPDLRAPADDDPLGQPSAIVAETSTTTIDVSLETLLSSDHVIVAYPMAAEPTEADPAACAPIGGTLTESGELVIGMAEQDDSGLTGIVYLVPAEGDPEQTDVSVFLASDLASGDNGDATPGA